MRVCFLWVAFTLAFVLLVPGPSRAEGQGFTTLDVNGEQVTIYRDEFGVPHIFADTNYGLFVGYGYVIAQDRLWQLEVNRRAARGTLAEILGPGFISADRSARMFLISDATLDAEFFSLSDEEQGIITAYVDGINRYMNDVIAPDVGSQLPFEFQFLGIGIPTAWTARDVVQVAAFSIRPPPMSGREITNLSLLQSLQTKFGVTAGFDVFNDVRWINDPDAPVSIPTSGAFGKRSQFAPPGQVDAPDNDPSPAAEEAETAWEAVGAPTHGSHAWVISPAKSASGFAMLFGGPQLNLPTPSNIHEVELHGGNGFNVIGMGFPGAPVVGIGRTDHIAWTVTSFLAADIVDTFAETTCAGGTGYMFNGICTSYDVRLETIKVKGAAPVSLKVVTSVHGPVVGTAPGINYAQKRAITGHEQMDIHAFLSIDRARSLDDFDAAVAEIGTAYNVLYADRIGNIGFWATGVIPVRAPGLDPRLPTPGDGSAEWIGENMPVLKSINPTRGWLANWNDKPTVDYDNPDSQIFGKQSRLREIEAHLDNTATVSLDDMHAIAADIGRTTTGSIGRSARYIKPYLLAALDAVPPVNANAAQAKAILQAWDGSNEDDVVNSTTLAAGQVIFNKWLNNMVSTVFGDELGTKVSEATPNMLIHVLDAALGGGSGVPPTRDYFNGADPNQVMSTVFDNTLLALGSSASWSTQPRPLIRFRHILFPVVPEAGTLPDSNRASFAQVVVLSTPRIGSESVLVPGESGFIQSTGGTPVLDPHFNDQLGLAKNFVYKHAALYKNLQLQE